MPGDNHPNASTPEKQQPSGYPLDRYSVQPKQESGDGADQSPYFKSAAPSISLPKGGGALKGIDEKFTVNAVNGTSSLQVALPLTPGRGGFTPALSISYNSGGGNSEFGLGWSLSLPAIQRKTDRQIPAYNDAHDSDVFLLAGAEDLVPELDSSGLEAVIPLAGNYKIRRYRPRIEGLFARIEFIRDITSTASWWRVTTKDNITTYYGLTANSRITDPESASRIFKWLPEIVCDHKGNVQQYFYKDEDLVGISGLHEKNRLNGTAPITNKYLKQLSYCNDTPWFNHTTNVYAPALPGTGTGYLMTAVLDYGDHSAANYLPAPDQPWPCRHDAYSDFHAGFEIRTYRTCRRVLMFHKFAELNAGIATLVRSLELAYQNDGLSAGVFAETDYIKTVTQHGYKITGGVYHNKSLPPITLTHQPLQWNTQLHSVSRKDAENAPQGLTGPYQWIDLWGEGLPGILTEQGTGWFYKTNLGDGHFTPALQVTPKPSLQGLGDTLQWQDLDADGRRQLVSRDPSLPGYFELDDDQHWQNFRAFPHNANIDWKSPYTRLLDLDGDGRPDLLLTEDRVWTWYRNEGMEGMVTGGQSQVSINEEKGPRLLMDDNVQRIFLADMIGDGLTDLVRIENGSVCYWPNKGYGRFGAKVTMSDAPRFSRPEEYNPLYLTLADISGTGAADLIYLGNNRCTVFINLAGNAWSAAQEIATLPGIEPYSKIAVLDFLGNGTGCIVWSSPLPQHAHAPMRYIDLMGGVKPYLMLSYQNGMGKEIALTYKSSSKYYLADKVAGKPWATRLPFPVQCVSKITTTDEVSETVYTQSFNYHHGYYDHEEREFRGFGRVDTLDTEAAIFYTAPTTENDLDQAPVLTKTWYHTGAWMREKTLIDQFVKEYYQFEGWDDVTVIADFPTRLTPQELREAHRALKGQALRQEVYALDGTGKQDIPYTVTASAFCIKMVQGQYRNRFASFYSYQQQSIAFSCERNAGDPRIAHSLTLEVDQYGNVLQSAEVVYPRKHMSGSVPLIVGTEQAKMHVTYSKNTFTNDVLSNNNHYRLRMPASKKSYELKGLSAPVDLWTVADLLTDIAASAEIDFLDTTATGLKMRLLSSTRVRYLADDAASILPLVIGGDLLQPLGLVHQQYQLAFTEGFISVSGPYGGRVDDARLTEGKYIELDGDDNYWLQSGTVKYTSTPEDSFYTPVEYVDPWDEVTAISYWGSYWLLPKSVEDAAGNTTTVTAYDWRILQPISMKDPNDNIAEMAFDVLGMPAAMAVKGKGTEADNLTGLDTEDTATQALFWADPEAHAATLLGNATWRCVYDLSVQPTAVAMIARERHYADLAISTVLIRITYTDGFGRVAMHKAQAADDPATGAARWIGSGKTVYNNKGKPVLQYEPYFSPTHEYDPAVQAANGGVSARLYYDPLGRVRRTEMPDGTFSYSTWDAWMQTVYDANDTVTDSDWYAGIMALPIVVSTSAPIVTAADVTRNLALQDGAIKATTHYNTPTVMHLDSLARPFYTIQLDGINAPIESYEVLDMQGNRLRVIDGRGNTPLTYKYNLLKAVISQLSIDSGQSYMLLDVAGQPLYHWDANDKEFHSVYDVLRRPLEQWGDGKMLSKISYGEGLASDKAKNLRGQVVDSYDGAGKHYVNEYDFKGQPKKSYMRLFIDASKANVNWNSFTDSDLVADEAFFTEVITDAFGRPMSADSGRILGTTTTTTEHNITYNTYGKGGALKTVKVSSDTYVQDIRHNAKGQREAIWYGNGTKTSYIYDAKSYRLTRLLTVNLTTNDKLQDLNYFYDPVGNITTIRDDAQETVFFSGTIITPQNEYTYDALYRLIEANGREKKANATFGTTDNSDDAHAFVSNTEPLDGSNSALQHYTQNYQYDAVGNILELQHIAAVGSFTRTYGYGTGSNRLASTQIGIATPYIYSHDARGNMIAMPHLSTMTYDLLNQMSHITAATVDAYYQYSGGQRVRKYLDKGSSITEERIYFGSYEVYRKWTGATLDVERTTLHVADDTGRIAMLEKRTQGSDGSAASLARYIYSNHLQSATLELDDAGAIISYEEYHPFGTTAYQASNSAINAVAKRYRYTGKERDEESGLYYHGARYYVPWLCRWAAVDPLASKYAGQSPFNYCFNNPTSHTDNSGKEPDPEKTTLEGVTISAHRTWGDRLNNLINKLEKVLPGAESVERSVFGTDNLKEIRSGAVERAASTAEGLFHALERYAKRELSNKDFGKLATVDPGIAKRSTDRMIDDINTVGNAVAQIPKALAKDYGDLIKKASHGDRRAIGGVIFEGALLIVPGGDEIKGVSLAEKGAAISEKAAVETSEKAATGLGISMEKTAVSFGQETTTDLVVFGNKTSPRSPRPLTLNGKGDIFVNESGMVSMQSGIELPQGASAFSSPELAPLTGHYHIIPEGTKLPAGLGVVADSKDVIKGSTRSIGHHTIFPTEDMLFEEFVNKFFNIKTVYGGRK